MSVPNRRMGVAQLQALCIKSHEKHKRYHESLDNVMPADVYQGWCNDILDQRALTKSRTLSQRKIHHLKFPG